jgi:hypothetical protein
MSICLLKESPCGRFTFGGEHPPSTTNGDKRIVAKSATQCDKGGINAASRTAFNPGLAGNEVPANDATT